MPRLPIRTRRLILRDFRPADLAAYRELRSHADFQRHYAPPDVSAEKSAELLEDFLRWAAEDPRLRYQLAIEEPHLGLLGSCGVRITDDDYTQATFGCELGRDYWRRGYATEAARALIGFAFSELGVHRVQAGTTSGNRPALSLAMRLGMRIEGRPREGRQSETGESDNVTLAVLSSEWKG